MAGEWIKVEKTTARKPEILVLADVLKIHPDHSFGLCVRFWCWCDDQLADCHAPSVTEITLDTVFGHQGFASALVKVGWLRVRNGSLEVPNFDRHLSESAKARALSANRQKLKRVKSTVTKTSRSQRDKNGTPLLLFSCISSCILDSSEIRVPSPLCNEQFAREWNRWIKHRHEMKKDVKPTQAEAQLAEFAEVGVQKAIETIRYTIKKGWQGLRHPDEDEKQSSKPTRRQQNIEGFV